MMPVKSPLKAVHAFCVECNGSGIAANSCPTEDCLLHPFRRGTVKRGSKPGPVLKAIRKYCQSCMGGERAEVERCTAGEKCLLYPFRKGRNPNRAKREARPLSDAQKAALFKGKNMPEMGTSSKPRAKPRKDRPWNNNCCRICDNLQDQKCIAEGLGDEPCLKWLRPHECNQDCEPCPSYIVIGTRAKEAREKAASDKKVCEKLKELQKPVPEKLVQKGQERPYEKILELLDIEPGLSRVQLQKRLEHSYEDLQHILDIMVEAGEIKMQAPTRKGEVARYMLTRACLMDRIIEQVQKGVDNYKGLSEVLGKDKGQLKPAVRQLISARRLKWMDGYMGRLEIPGAKKKEKPAPVEEKCPDLGGPKCPCEDVRGCSDAAPMMAERELKAAKEREEHEGPCRTCSSLEPYPADKDGKERGKCINRKATAFGRVIRGIDQVRKGCWSRKIEAPEELVCCVCGKEADGRHTDNKLYCWKHLGEVSDGKKPSLKKAKKQPCEICGRPVLMMSEDPDKVGGGFGGPGLKEGLHYSHDRCERAFPGLARKIAAGQAEQLPLEEVKKGVEKMLADLKAKRKKKKLRKCSECGHEIDLEKDPEGPRESKEEGWILCAPCWHKRQEAAQAAKGKAKKKAEPIAQEKKPEIRKEFVQRSLWDYEEAKA